MNTSQEKIDRIDELISKELNDDEEYELMVQRFVGEKMSDKTFIKFIKYIIKEYHGTNLSIKLVKMFTAQETLEKTCNEENILFDIIQRCVKAIKECDKN